MQRGKVPDADEREFYMRKYYADFPKDHEEVTKGFKIIRKKTQLQLH